MKKFAFIIMLFPFTVFAVDLPTCDNTNILDMVKQQNKSVVIAKLISPKGLANSAEVNEVEKTLKGITLKTKNVADLKLKNDSDVRVCKAEIGLFIQDQFKEQGAIFYIVEKDKSDPSKTQVKSEIAF